MGRFEESCHIRSMPRGAFGAVWFPTPTGGIQYAWQKPRGITLNVLQNSPQPCRFLGLQQLAERRMSIPGSSLCLQCGARFDSQ